MLNATLADGDTSASAWETIFARLSGPVVVQPARPDADRACLRPRPAPGVPAPAAADLQPGRDEAGDAIVEAFRKAFALTLAEARVLAALMAGELPKRYAMRMGLSINTVRSQIAALMWKMGCQRQLDLVRKAMSCALALGEPAGERHS